MSRPVFSFRPNLENRDHKRAWEILQRVPEGQKNAFLVQAILQTEEAGHLERLIRQTIREELRDAQCFTKERTEKKPDEIPAQMLDFLSSMEEGM